MQVKKADVAFLAAAGAPPLAQSLLQRPECLRGGLLLIGPEGGKFDFMCGFFPIARVVIKRRDYMGVKRL